MKKEYKTDKIQIIIYGILQLLYIVFLGVVAVKYGVNANFFVLLLLMLPVSLRLFMLFRYRVTIDDEGIEIRDVLKSGKLKWKEIDSVGLSLRRKAYLFLTSKEKGGFLIDDSVEKFREILDEVEKHVDRKVLPKEWREAKERYSPSKGSLLLVIMAIAVILFVILKSI